MSRDLNTLKKKAKGIAGAVSFRGNRSLSADILLKAKALNALGQFSEALWGPSSLPLYLFCLGSLKCPELFLSHSRPGTQKKVIWHPSYMTGSYLFLF